MRLWVVVHLDREQRHRLISQHWTRSAAGRHAASLRAVLADIWSDIPLDGSYMGIVRVMSYRDWLEVPDKR